VHRSTRPASTSGAVDATAAVTITILRDIAVEKVDDLTVRISFDNPTPFWANAFVGPFGRHHSKTSVR
jgi:hypothetical protein